MAIISLSSSEFAIVIGLSVFEIGVLISSILVLTALLQRPFGYLADRFDRLNLIIFGFIFLPISIVRAKEGGIDIALPTPIKEQINNNSTKLLV